MLVLSMDKGILVRRSIGIISHDSTSVDFISYIINSSYQKLPFGSGDDPDKLFFHQALN